MNSDGRQDGVARRMFLRVGGVGAAAWVAAACAPAAAPPPAPAAPAAPQAPAKPAWEAEWDRRLALANQEGAVSIASITGAGIRAAFDEFGAAFPRIKVEYTGFPTYSLFIPRILQERNAGIYSWDVSVHSADVHLGEGTLRPNGVLDPVRPAIFRGDVLDDKVWTGGFESGFHDNEKRWGYGFTWRLEGSGYFWVNTELVRDGEIRSINDLLNPKWRGRMIMADPRTHGGSYVPFTTIRLNMGNADIMKKVFVEQEPVLTRDTRQIAEGLVRGRYAVGTGVTDALIKEFDEQGLAKNVKAVPIAEAEAVNKNTGAWLINRAPHPNAAVVFINWLLSKDGQAAWAKNIVNNSRRLDVPPGNPNAVAAPGRQFKVVHGSENMIAELKETQDIAKRLLD